MIAFATMLHSLPARRLQRTTGALFAAALLAAGCTSGPPPIVAGAPIDPVEDLPQRKSDGVLPAFETADEKLGKADGNDPRAAHPSYAFTTPPTEPVLTPGEFEQTQLMLLAWDDSAWSLEAFFIDLIKAAHKSVQVVIYVESNQSANLLYDVMWENGIDVDRVALVRVELDSIWIRDFGPLVVKSQEGDYKIMDFRYYWGRFADDVLPTRLANAWGIDVHRPPVENEGGNFLADGMGRCISTERVLSQNQLLGHTRASLTQAYRDYFGCSVTLFLPELDGEGTGHVDMYATITGPGEIIVGSYTSWDDPVNAERLDAAAEELEDAGLLVRRIPMPKNTDGNFRSYTNSLAVNDVVLVPVYRDDTRYEDEALATFQAAYPDRQIMPVDATEVITWAGAIHCVTQSIAW